MVYFQTLGNSHYLLSSFIIEIGKEIIKIKCKINSVIVNLHNYCNNHVFLHNFTWITWVSFELNNWLKCDTFSIYKH